MKTSYLIPREALASLLQATGSAMTPEQYVASLVDANAFRKYPSRSWVAATSKYFLLIVAVLSVSCLPVLGFSLENLIVAAGLGVVTFFEYRVHAYFRENDPRAPILGFRNQAAFAVAILLYCLYHAFATYHFSAQDQILIEQNNLIDPGTLKGVMRLFYLFIAALAGGSQFGLACFYRSAGVNPKT